MRRSQTRPRIDLSYAVFPLGLPSADDVRRFAMEAEKLGYGGIWVRDHLLLHEPVYDPTVLLGVIAGCTENIELGTSVYLPVLRNPVAVAKAFATLSQLSGRIINYGVGAGGEYSAEWQVAGVPIARRGRCLDESIRLVTRLWEGLPTSHDGRCFPQFKDIVLDLLPADRPRLWIGGKSDAALHRTARLGQGWLAYFRSRRTLAEQFERLDELINESARPVRSVERALILYAVVSDDVDRDTSVAREFCARDLARPFEELIDRYGLIGPASFIAEEMSLFHEIGVDRFLILFPVEPSQLRCQSRRFATEVLPLLAERVPGAEPYEDG